MFKIRQQLTKGCIVSKNVVSLCGVFVCAISCEQVCFSQQITTQSFIDRFDSNGDGLIQKDEAKKLMSGAGVPIVPGCNDLEIDLKVLMSEARKVGYPVLIKAAAGGGGGGDGDPGGDAGDASTSGGTARGIARTGTAAKERAEAHCSELGGAVREGGCRLRLEP